MTTTSKLLLTAPAELGYVLRIAVPGTMLLICTRANRDSGSQSSENSEGSIN